MKKLLSGILILIFTMMTVVAIGDGLPETASYLTESVKNPTVASVGGEWAVVGLARSEENVPDGYFEKYYNNLTDYVISKNGVLHRRKYTEYSRVVLALTAIGKNPCDVSGYNLTEPLFDYDTVISQGLNGAVWAVIALNSGSYGTDDINDRYIEYILGLEKENGGWSLSADTPEPEADITAMTLTALSFFRDKDNVASAVERGINVLSDLQDENGVYRAFGDIPNAESCAQVLTALSSLGISQNDERFTKNGNTTLDGMMSFRLDDGSFCHTDKSNLMATEQCFYALVSLKRFEEGKNAVFNMNEEKADDNKKPQINVKQITKEITPHFVDVEDDENGTAIYELAKREIINGVSENIFLPEGKVTRAEFAAMVIRALGLETSEKSDFSDVEHNAWYSEYIAAAKKHGIINGISDSEFDPNGNVTIEQSCVIISKAARLCGIENNLDGSEIEEALRENGISEISEWARAGTAFAIKNKILQPTTDKSVEPSEFALRCETAQMLYNLLIGAKLI